MLVYYVSDRFMPVLVKSLRSQRVRHVTAGEYHTAILTEVNSLGFLLTLIVRCVLLFDIGKCYQVLLVLCHGLKLQHWHL